VFDRLTLSAWARYSPGGGRNTPREGTGMGATETIDRDELLREIKARLQAALGLRLAGVVLYGSEARRTARPDSDIDLMVLLNDTVRPWADLSAAVEAVVPLAIRFGRLIHPDVVERSTYETSDFPLFRNVRAEGVLL